MAVQEKKMGRPTKAGRPTQVRLTDEIIDELDEWAAEVREGDTFGASGASRSDIIREIVVKALRERREARGQLEPSRKKAGAASSATKAKR
jgi:Arc/MetJ-type ribon-helix-helix transcriptional regulator